MRDRLGASRSWPGTIRVRSPFLGAASRTEIFGILKPDEWQDAGDASLEDGELVVNLRICAASPPGGAGPTRPPFAGPVIPLLEVLEKE